MLDNFPGRELSGLWHKHSYRIVRTLGKGENGTVYLALKGKTPVALKVGQDSAALALEWERMRELGSGLSSPCPPVYELDDFEYRGVYYSYFAMAYIDGLNLRQYVALKGRRVLPGCLLQVAQHLDRIHSRGYAYCDLKPENLLVDTHSGKLLLIDFGGATPLGSGVKEYTEIYDRYYWGYGERRADPHYDYFSLAVMGAFLQNPLTGKDKERLSQMRHEERKRMLKAVFSKKRGRFPLYNALQFMVEGKVPDYGLIAFSLKSAQRGPSKSARFQGWDRTDWGFLFSVLIFSSILVSILVLGGHQSAFVIQ